MSESIKKEFRKFGENYKLIQRTGDVALYQRDSGFEVVVVRRCKKDVYLGDKLLRGVGDEYLPSTEEFGSYGWMYTSLGSAVNKLNSLVLEVVA